MNQRKYTKKIMAMKDCKESRERNPFAVSRGVEAVNKSL